METPTTSIDRRGGKPRVGRFLASLTRTGHRATPAPVAEPVKKTVTYTPDTIVHPVMPEGGRPVADYELLLGFNRSELEGKKVLDLGAGPELKFAKELHDAGSTAWVVSLSPDFVDKRHTARAHEAHPEGAMVAGTGNNLPFATGSFDRVYALRVLDHLPRDANSFFGFLGEVGRVLADNGEARLGPCNEIFTNASLRVNEAFVQQLAQNGIAIAIERNTDAPATIRTYDDRTGISLGNVQPDAIVLRKNPVSPAAPLQQ